MIKAMQTADSRTGREAADERLHMSERVRASLYLARRIHRHDFRALRTFLRRTFPDTGWIGRAGLFLAWLHGQCWEAIPRALRTTSFAKPVSDTPIWLTDQNPLAGHPWSGDPGARLPEHAEVVVIGAGFTGASLAYHWAKSGVPGSMVVVDMGDPASGASGRNAGEVVMGRYFAMVFATVRKHLTRVRPDLSAQAMDRMSRQFADIYCRAAYKNADLVERTIRAEGFACDYAREGWVRERPADEQGELEQTVRMGVENGFDDWSRISADEASSKTGARIAMPANYSRRAARFHPAKWVWSLFGRALKSATVRLFTRTRVLQVIDEGEEYRVVTERGSIHARYVVNATEAYTAKLQTAFIGVVEPRQSQAAYGLDGGRSVKPNLPFSGSTFFCVRHRDGILFGSDETPLPAREAGRNRPSRFITAFVAAQLGMRFGGFPLRVTNEWAGSVGFTPDEYPIVGLMDEKRQYVIAGMSGSGTAVSFNAGRSICARIQGREDDDDYPAAYFAPSRLLNPAGHSWPALTKD
jgi:glycine/D-amino acid oxidase-like deaminating enzyme